MGWHGIRAANATFAASVLSATPLHDAGGPVVVGIAASSLDAHARAAAAVWNAYLPNLAPKTYNLESVDLPDNVVGRIWVPCNNTCSVQIDPSYPAPFNVILHEFGHGIGLPYGAASGVGTFVDYSNHWAPESADPGELMTATLHPTPHLAMYTLDAMSPTHGACHTAADCNGYVCDAAPVHLGPKLCRKRYYHLENVGGYFGPLFVWLIFLPFIFLLTVGSGV